MLLPGLSVEVLRPAQEPEPLRTDIAGFVGRTRRGPHGVPTRVAGLRDFQERFAGLDARWSTPYSARGYFENGGQVAHVVCLGGAGAATASAIWTVGTLTGGRWGPDAPAGAGFAVDRYRIEATSPGRWANDTAVTFTYRSNGLARRHELDVRVEVPGEEPELHAAVPPATLEAALAGSRFIRVTPVGNPGPPSDGSDTGPSGKVWPVVTLRDGEDGTPALSDYLQAVERLGDVAEVALVVLPDIHRDLGAQAAEALRALLEEAVPLQDRLLLVDAPAAHLTATEATAWLGDPLADPPEGLRAALGPELLRAAAVYHPWIRVPDPLGGVGAPLRDVPPSGHVAGLVSRLDRERGPHHTPANARLSEAVDLAAHYGDDEQGLLYASGLNLVRCRPGRGLEVWGGRTLDHDEPRRFVAHRRLLHRLVRAIRQVADPLVFEPNAPELWFTLRRSIGSVLLEAFRSGALKGATPDQAFQVRCDETVNPPGNLDAGLVVCEIDVAPAAPMEFIRLRLSFTRQGDLEVVEA